MWERKDDESPCRACMVVLEEENVDAVKVFLSVRHHVVLHEVEREKTLVDLDIRAVKAAMEIYKVRDQEKCYEKVRRLFFGQGKEDVMAGEVKKELPASESGTAFDMESV